MREEEGLREGGISGGRGGVLPQKSFDCAVYL